MTGHPLQTMGWIDTHAHLDAAEFDGKAREVAARARQAGVVGGVIPAVERGNSNSVRELAQSCGWAYALGIHPLFVDRALEADLDVLRHSVAKAMADPRFVGLGEIGLDFFVPGLDREKQLRFYLAQLRIARDFDLPVILHVRKSQDALLAGLRRAGFGAGRPAGIAHAFNGSLQQAQGFINLGFALGFGGAMTFKRALNIRRLAADVPEAALVLETDAPDIPPVWLYRPIKEAQGRPKFPCPPRGAGRRADPGGAQDARDDAPPTPNSPEQLPRITQTLAALRGWSPEHTARQTTANALRVLPRLAGALNLGIESPQGLDF